MNIASNMLADTATGSYMWGVLPGSLRWGRTFNDAEHASFSDNVELPKSLKNLLFIRVQCVCSWGPKYHV